MIEAAPAWAWILFAALPCAPLALTLVNLLTWWRPRPRPLDQRVSLLVPARNEEATIERCVRAAMAQPAHEILVYDDGSTDRTAAIVAQLAQQDARVRLIPGVPLPAGWVGKPHACHRLAQAATGDHLCFVDADTTLREGAIEALGAVSAPLVTAFPQQQAATLGEALIVSLLHLTYTSWLPLRLVAAVSDPRVLAANGQVLRITRDAYDRTGGFAAVRDAIVDDMALCRRAKACGVTVAFVPGDHLATCRMYASGSEAWRGFAKNLYPGIGSPVGAGMVGLIYVACFVAPWVGWGFAPVPAVVGMAANLLQRTLLAVRFRLPWTSVVLHLPSVLAFLGILITSARWTARGQLQWRGRAYTVAGGAS